MIKKKLRHLHAIVNKQTYWHLLRWAASSGWGEKDLGRVIDKLVRDRAMSESAYSSMRDRGDLYGKDS